MRSLRLTALALAGALVLAGCGSLEVPYKGPRIVPATPITAAELGRFPAGSPQRVVLQLYQRLRANQLAAATRAFAPKARKTGLSFVFRLGAARKVVHATSSFRVLDVIRHGPLTTVFTTGDVLYRSPNGRVDGLLPLPQAFTLVRQRGRWVFPDDSWVRYAAKVTFVRDPRQAVNAPIPRLVTRGEMVRYRPGTPVRSALEFLRTLQFGDPAGAPQYLTKAWKATSARAARVLGTYREASWGFRGPVRIVSSSRGSVVLQAPFARKVPVLVRMTKDGGRWKVARLRVGPLVVPK